MPYESAHPKAQCAVAARPVTGRFVLVTFVSFFGVIAAVNAVMMTLAIRTMPGLDVRNGYVASQAMNGEIEAMRRQVERGWKADVIALHKDGLAQVGINLVDSNLSPVTGLKIKGRLAHLTLTRADHSAVLIEHRPGVYAAELPDVQAGGWTLIIEAYRNEKRIFSSRNRVVLKEGRP